jgi:hypothetical protein
MRLLLAISSAALLLWSTGCGERCATCPQSPLVSATYQGSGPFTPAPDAGTFPWGTARTTLELDVAGRIATLRYQRDGHAVVETWHIRSLSECPP